MKPALTACLAKLLLVSKNLLSYSTSNTASITRMEFASVVSGLDVKDDDDDGGQSFPIERLFGYRIILHKRTLSLASHVFTRR